MMIKQASWHDWTTNVGTAVALVMAILMAPAIWPVGAPTAPSTPMAQALAIESLIRPDGALDLNTARSGTLDLTGWTVTLDAQRGPLFERAEHRPRVPEGSSWYPLGRGTTGEVRTIAVGGGVLYVGGDFTSAGDCARGCNRIAQWDGSGWSAVGYGVNDRVYALAVGADGAVYAGGFFTQICGSAACDKGNTPARKIARWTGAEWLPLNHGLSSDVTSIAVTGAEVYVGGYFRAACGNAACDRGNTPVNMIAKWTGAAWSALGHGLDGPVFALAVSGAEVYAGGYFSTVCGTVTCMSGTPVNGIAKWTGTAWSALNFGLNSGVLAVAVSGAEVYAGGYFNMVCGDAACSSGTPVNRIAHWNGAAWSPLNFGVDGAVLALAVSGGEVYAGGSFTRICANAACTIGSMTVNRIARWNDTTWSPLDTGLASGRTAAAIALTANTVYVGGNFAQLGACLDVNGCNYVGGYSAGLGIK